MLADHAARVFSGGACLGAEARRTSGDTDGKLGLVGDVLTHEIGERDFGGRDEPISLLAWCALQNIAGGFGIAIFPPVQIASRSDSLCVSHCLLGNNSVRESSLAPKN